MELTARKKEILKVVTERYIKVADNGGRRLTGLGDDGVQLPHLAAQGSVNLGRLLVGHAAPLHPP